MLVYATVVNYHSIFPTRAERSDIFHQRIVHSVIPDKHLVRRIKSDVLIALEYI